MEKSLLERICIILRPASWSTVLINWVVHVLCGVLKKKRFSNNLSCNWLLQHFTTHSKIKGYSIQTLKKLLKSEIVNRSDLRNSVYLWLNFSILFSVFLKSRRDCRMKSIFMCILFLCSFFNSPLKHKSVYKDIKLCHEIKVLNLLRC